MDAVDLALKALGAIKLSDWAPMDELGRVAQEKTGKDEEDRSVVGDGTRQDDENGVTTLRPGLGAESLATNPLIQETTLATIPRTNSNETLSRPSTRTDDEFGAQNEETTSTSLGRTDVAFSTTAPVRPSSPLLSKTSTPPALASTARPPAARPPVPAMGKSIATSTSLQSAAFEDIHMACNRARPFAVEAVCQYTADSKAIFGCNLVICRRPSPGQARELDRMPVLFYTVRPSLPSKRTAKITVSEMAVKAGCLEQVRRYGVYGECGDMLAREEAMKILADMDELGRQGQSAALSGTKRVSEFSSQAYSIQPSHFISPEEFQAKKEAAALLQGGGRSNFVGELYEYCQKAGLGVPEFISSSTPVHVEMSPLEMAAQKHLTGRVMGSSTRVESKHVVDIRVGGSRFKSRTAFHKVKDAKEAMAKLALDHLKKKAAAKAAAGSPA